VSAIETENVEDTRLTFAQSIGDALRVALRMDDSVFLLGEDIQDPGGGSYGATKGLSTEFGLDRVRPTPITEQAILGAAIGSSLVGMRPVAEIMLMNFITVCMDQLFNHAAKLRYMSGGQTHVPITVRTATGGGFGFGGQHSDMLEAWIVHSPGLKIVVPSSADDAKGLLLSCIFDDDPCVFVEMNFLYFSPMSTSQVPSGDYRVPLGKARVRRTGDDVTILTYGRQVHDSLEAAAQLEQEGVQVEVVDLRSLVPLDLETVLSSVARTGRAVIVHEAVRRNGFGAELAATISEELFGQLHGPVRRVAAKNAPIPYAEELENNHLPQVADIVHAVRSLND
jgi:pyruvate/2-oxoglutarate/acetoin dehydrogenase E1 component